MAFDRFIYWTDLIPSKKDIELVLVNFFGDAAEVKWNKDRWFVTLKGETSVALKDVCKYAAEFHNELMSDTRWIEVWWSEGRCIDIITRMQDDYTNCLAEGLEAVIKRHWRAKNDDCNGEID